MNARALIFGCAGPDLAGAESDFFRDASPWGFILFERNCIAPEQVRRLVRALRESVGRMAPVFIDQEGGRVARLKPPYWPNYPPAARIGALYERDAEGGREAAYLAARLIAVELYGLGLTVDCLPVLDVPQESAHGIIGDRAYASKPQIVSELGHCACEGLMDGGILPVIKHIPGHGRASVDSHESLPVVDATVEELRATDFPPFSALSDMPLAMTAHVVYTAYDNERPATLSPRVVGEVIRGELGFGGLLLTDDLSMGALVGPLERRAEAALRAGCDVVLHCNGDRTEMAVLAEAVPVLEGKAARRAEWALNALRPPAALDEAAARAAFAALIDGEG